MNSAIPVTLLCGFLGSGKTTLLNRILAAPGGERIAVIENEFGAENIDTELLSGRAANPVRALSNGCLCCSVRDDLVRTLDELASRRETGELVFDRVIIETSGLADPAPVCQTFFVQPLIATRYRLDAVITLVDARHAMQQLDAHVLAQEQIGFADRILISKSEHLTATELAVLEQRVRDLNPRAVRSPTRLDGPLPTGLLDLNGFKLDAALALDPDFLAGPHTHSHDSVQSYVFRGKWPFDSGRLHTALDLLIGRFGARLLRYKGVLDVEGQPRRVVLQGVHDLWSGDLAHPWGDAERRASRLVFIGRDLPRAAIAQALDYALSDARWQRTQRADTGAGFKPRLSRPKPGLSL